METVRIQAQDSFYALLVSYLVLQSRSILADFTNINSDARVCSIDSVDFRIVKKIVGEPHEIPGVNLVFYEDYEVPFNPSRLTYIKLATVHIYTEASNNLSADDNTLLKLQRRIDAAFYTKGVNVVDFYENPPVSTPMLLSWDMVNSEYPWLELTNLANQGYLHRAKSFKLFYRDLPVT